jgi:hypothetical protein
VAARAWVAAADQQWFGGLLRVKYLRWVIHPLHSISYLFAVFLFGDCCIVAAAAAAGAACPW